MVSWIALVAVVSAVAWVEVAFCVMVIVVVVVRVLLVVVVVMVMVVVVAYHWWWLVRLRWWWRWVLRWWFEVPRWARQCANTTHP